MINTHTVDLLALISADVPLRKAASTRGGEYAGPCPFCGGHEKRAADRFRVWPAEGRYWCRRCTRHGDAITYMRERHGLTFPAALAHLGLSHPSRPNLQPATAEPATAVGPATCAPPSPAWQQRATAFAADCAAHLWGSEGVAARTWLRDVRGLDEAAIEAARLGYNPCDRREPPALWGLPADANPVWLPRGITIPWVSGRDLWRVNIRRPAGTPRYTGPAGAANGLYGADALVPGRPAVLVEGELDALAVNQRAQEVAPAVAAGSVAGSRRIPWIARLALCSRVLVAFDADPAGEEAARYWLAILANARRWRPYYGKDPNAMAAFGGDIVAWVQAGLQTH